MQISIQRPKIKVKQIYPLYKLMSLLFCKYGEQMSRKAKIWIRAELVDLIYKNCSLYSHHIKLWMSFIFKKGNAIECLQCTVPSPCWHQASAKVLSLGHQLLKHMFRMQQCVLRCWSQPCIVWFQCYHCHFSHNNLSTS